MALLRVESHYRGLWSAPPVVSQVHTDTVSMVLWESDDTPSSWPAWSQGSTGAVASTYVPLGFERLTGLASLADSPHLLAQSLIAAPSGILELAAPFMLASLDTDEDRLDIFTDALGIGRLFEVRTPTGWVWSNRPVAALRYAGLVASRDEVGWDQFAVADEFFGSTTPYAGVTVIDAATHLRWDGRRRRRTVTSIDVVATWGEAPPEAARHHEMLAETADSLRSVATSINRLFPEQPVVDLSGGRDSRLVASAFLASGVDVVLHSHDAVPGDLVTARELVSRLTTPIEHRISHRPTGGRTAPRPFSTVGSARRWHRYSEGLRPGSFVGHGAPAHLDVARRVTIGGVGGEVAHGFYYPGNVAALDTLPIHEKIEAFAAGIVARHAAIPGSSSAARTRLRSHVHGVLSGIAARGIRDATMLDFYYLRERLRRWGMTAESLGIVSPLLTPSFLRAGLSLSPADRSGNVLHRGVVRELVPQWADAPFFPGEVLRAQAAAAAPPPPPPRIRRLADSTDADEFTGVLATPDFWGSGFDLPRLFALWHRSVAGQTTAAEEHALNRAAWAATFEDFLALVNGTPPPERPAAEVPAGVVPHEPTTVQPPRSSRWTTTRASLRRQPAVRTIVRSRPFAAFWHSRPVRNLRGGPGA